MAGLQARSPLRSTHPLLIINKLVSLTAFTVLLVAGWVAVCYLKAEMTGTADNQAAEKPSVITTADAATTAVQVKKLEGPEVKRLSAPVRLVYSCAGDGEFYHNSTHLPSSCDRSALSEEAAIRRGLKPCKICMPE